MKLTIPLAIGAVLLIMTQSKSPSFSKKDKDFVIQGKVVIPTIDPLQADEVFEIKCKEYQYYDKNSKKCITYWSGQETVEKIKSVLKDEILKEYNVPNMGPAFIPQLCEDASDFSNTNSKNILKRTINKIWPNIKIESLPPKVSDPQWMMDIWIKTQNIYKEFACN